MGSILQTLSSLTICRKSEWQLASSPFVVIRLIATQNLSQFFSHQTIQGYWSLCRYANPPTPLVSSPTPLVTSPTPLSQFLIENKVKSGPFITKLTVSNENQPIQTQQQILQTIRNFLIDKTLVRVSELTSWPLVSASCLPVSLHVGEDILYPTKNIYTSSLTTDEIEGCLCFFLHNRREVLLPL